MWPSRRLAGCRRIAAPAKLARGAESTARKQVPNAGSAAATDEP